MQDDEIKILWEIFLPSHFSNQKKIKRNHHKKWEEHVGEITRELHILIPRRNFWRRCRECSIFVQISCTRKQMSDIVDYSALHYCKHSIRYYKISSESHVEKFDFHFKRIIQ